MQQKISLKLLPSEAVDEKTIKKLISHYTGKNENAVTGYHLLKKSLDSRSRTTWVNLVLNAFLDEPFIQWETPVIRYPNVKNARHSVLIIGAGPAGLFAALHLIELGIKPILIERGKKVRERRRDLALLNREGILDPESNYCFGEGGAGTYSDGKLYTRSNKRGDTARILDIFIRFGASENIRFESHPHIGTNKLPQIITAMRQQIIQSGGEYYVEKKLTGFSTEKGMVRSISTADGDNIKADAYILATGHSARDIYFLLNRSGIAIESKAFALGVRVEHPQEMIDQVQYHCNKRDDDLPAASYNLVEQVNSKGVFSFCMCPGGIIAPASTSPGELVVNGWSPSKRNNPFANSGIVVEIKQNDLFSCDGYKKFLKAEKIPLENNPLSMLYFQQWVERNAFLYGGGKYIAPAQRMVDFTQRKLSPSLPACSYLPGTNSVTLDKVLPLFIYNTLAGGFPAFGKKMKGYFSNEAIVVATESRTSSPVRIPRDKDSLTHLQLKNLYPCGEGAGYAGGIMSAAMDGERVAKQLATVLL